MRLPESRFTTTTRRRRSGLPVVIIAAVVAAGAVTGGVFLLRSRSPILPLAESERTVDLIALWNNGEYDALVAEASVRLSQAPVNETALTLRGFGRFYLAMEEVSEEERHENLVGSVQDLQRVLLLPEISHEGEVHYVLGKAFFHRGRFFYDTAIEHLRSARDMGIVQLDLLEYLALASESLQLYDDAIAYYEEAIEMGGSPVHKVSLADLLNNIGNYDGAERLLLEAREETNDGSLLRHALLSLGESLRRQERWDDAVAVYEELIELHPASADGHFGLGETYFAMGDANLARYEWREAVRLNPNHIESLQRLQDD